MNSTRRRRDYSKPHRLFVEDTPREVRSILEDAAMEGPASGLFAGPDDAAAPGRPAIIRVMRGRGPFRVLNRTVNPALGLVLRSPLHGLASGRFALVTYTGRKSGRRYTIPVLYREKGDEVTIAVGWPERKVWWRNLTGDGGSVDLVVRGHELSGHAVATWEPGHDALVRVRLDASS